ncbi:MAG: DJ-1/PfpI family protein [Muribaculaceae bacterium]|nr:DJ-1/PfpI family protein [Muribaculaceae bacterium]
MKKSFLFLADGFEEIEALTPVDILRRAGIDVTTVSIMPTQEVKGAHGVTVKADMMFGEGNFEDAEWLILPGGMPGAQNLHDCEPLMNLVKAQAASESGRIAAICAAPAVVLGAEGLLGGRKATAYPGFESQLIGAEVVSDPVVIDSKFVLAPGPAKAAVWALGIVRETLGIDKAAEVASQMLFPPTVLDPLMK